MTNDDAIVILTMVSNLLQYEVNDNNSLIIEAVNFAIDNLKNTRPTVEPKRGKWIRQDKSRTEFFCSECGRMIDTKPFTRTDNFPFCHCGAEMEADSDNT